MPTVQGTKYPYTKAGIKAASIAKRKVQKAKLKRVGKTPRRTA